VNHRLRRALWYRGITYARRCAHVAVYTFVCGLDGSRGHRGTRRLHDSVVGQEAADPNDTVELTSADGLADDPNAEPDDGADADTEIDEVALDPAAERAADLDDENASEPATDLSDVPAAEFADSDDDDALDEADDSDASQSVADDPSVQGALSSIPTKIRYILIIVKENHTFDNYFTGFPGATSSAYATAQPDDRARHG
jgi:hypothetical protein